MVHVCSFSGEHYMAPFPDLTERTEHIQLSTLLFFPSVYQIHIFLSPSLSLLHTHSHTHTHTHTLTLTLSLNLFPSRTSDGSPPPLTPAALSEFVKYIYIYIYILYMHYKAVGSLYFILAPLSVFHLLSPAFCVRSVEKGDSK